jgi:hypothetical protein
MTRLLKPLAAAAALISSHAPLAQGAPVSQMHAYEGPRRPAAQLATVYGAIRLNRLDRTMICEVDGKSVRTFSGCRSIVYLLPGSHRLQISYSFGAIRKANGTLTASFAAGRVYHIESGPAGNWVSFRLREKPPGSALTYKDVYPDNPLLSVTVQGSRIDPAAE